MLNLKLVRDKVFFVKKSELKLLVPLILFGLLCIENYGKVLKANIDISISTTSHVMVQQYLFCQ